MWTIRVKLAGESSIGIRVIKIKGLHFKGFNILKVWLDDHCPLISARFLKS